MKIKLQSVVCLCLAVFAGLFSCVSNPADTASGTSVWEISKNGNTFYLGGSVHILREKDFPLPKEFDLAFRQSSILVLEADLDSMMQPDFLQALITQMTLPKGVTLDQVLGPEAYSLLKEKCAEYKFPFEGISIFKPSMIINILTMREIQKSGFVQQGVDMYYLEKAKKAKKSLDFLETVETQIDVLISMGEGYEDDFIIYSLHDLESTSEAVISIVAEWRNGGAEITEESIREMKDEWPLIYKDLLLDRNNAWIPQLENYLTTAPVEFVIVGLAHMHGPDGLLKQLEQSGCTVKKVIGGRQ